MGSSYMTLVGAPPSPLTLQFFKWINDLVAARIAECPLVRTTTYYFSQSGNDSTGDGSQGNPWKTIAKAQAIHDAAATNADIRLRFKRGDEWQETTGLTISKDNVTVDDYGSGAKPLFNRFTINYLDASNPWTLAAGDRYTVAETNTIAWLREKNDRLNPYIKVTSTAEVEANPRSWYWASNVLHVNAGTGVDPNTKDFEAVIANDNSGISVGGNGVRIQNLRCDGWGMNPANTANQNHGIRTTNTGTNSVLVVGCESYYASSHCIAHYVGGSSGGFSTFIDCKAGFAQNNGAGGETIFNSYAQQGGQETIFHNCEASFGTLQNATGSYSMRAKSCYHHTSGDSTPSALHIVFGMKAPASNWPIANGVDAQNLTSAVTLADCRGFNVFENRELPPTGYSGSSSIFAPSNMCCINNTIRVRPNAATGALTTTTMGGWFINGILDIDLSAQTSRLAAWNVASDVQTMKIWHSLIYVRGNKTTAFSLDYDAYNASSFCTGAELKNSIVCLLDPGGSNYVAFNANGTKMVNNAYTVDTFTDSTGNRRYSVDATRVELGSRDVPYPSHTPLATSSPLYQAGTALNTGYDINLNLRGPTPSIGPFEPVTALNLGRVTALTAAIASSTSITLSWTAASGLVNITDHEVKYRVVGTTSWTTFSHSLNPGNSITVTGLTAKTEYEFSVAPVSAWGTGNPEFVKATPYAGSDLRRVTVYPKVGT